MIPKMGSPIIARWIHASQTNNVAFEYSFIIFETFRFTI